jgi:hypothetical protein
LSGGVDLFERACLDERAEIEAHDDDGRLDRDHRESIARAGTVGQIVSTRAAGERDEMEHLRAGSGGTNVTTSAIATAHRASTARFVVLGAAVAMRKILQDADAYPL